MRQGFRKGLGAAGRLAVTLAVIGGAAGAGVAGRAVLAQRAAEAPTPQPAPATAVAPARIAIEDGFAAPRRFSGQFEPRQETALAFEGGGTVAEVRVREGDRVRRGQVVATLDTRLLLAERDRLAARRAGLEAQAELARRTDARQAELRERGFATDQAVDDTSLGLTRLEAGIAEVDAALAAVAVRTEKARILAPYDGTVGARLLDAGAVADAGAPVATLQEDGPRRFRVGLDPALARGLAVGERVVIETDEGPMPARLARLAPDLDAATRSRTAFFEVEGEPAARATGEVVLSERVEGRGAWVPLAALRSGPRGTWTLLTVDDAEGAPVVGVEAAEVIHLAEGRAFVRGTFRDGDAYLPGGTHRVVPGEPVVVVDAPAARPAEAPDAARAMADAATPRGGAGAIPGAAAPDAEADEAATDGRDASGGGAAR